MNRATPQMRNLAKRLLHHETDGKESSQPKTPPDFDVFEKLRPHLAILMGNGGYRALLARALALADVEAPGLRAVRVKSDGSLEGWEAVEGQAGPDELLEGKVVLLGQLLGLLVAFIGENLMLHLVRDIWPEVSLSDVEFSTGETK
jgi:hypothetical protein